MKKHTIKKETNIDGATGNINIVEEHVIIEKHTFLDEPEEEDEDLMFLGKKKTEDEEDYGPTLYIVEDDDKNW